MIDMSSIPDVIVDIGIPKVLLDSHLLMHGSSRLILVLNMGKFIVKALTIVIRALSLVV